jgi:hypothetical protein
VVCFPRNWWPEAERDVVSLGSSTVQAVWFLKCRALTEKSWIDDTEMEEEGVAEVLLDENATASAPRFENRCARCGTSFFPCLWLSVVCILPIFSEANLLCLTWFG